MLIAQREVERGEINEKRLGERRPPLVRSRFFSRSAPLDYPERDCLQSIEC